MISVSSPILVGGVQVATTQARGWSVDELAQRAADKIIYVGDQSHPAVREQARAFKEAVKHVVSFYLKEAVEQDRATIAQRLAEAGQSNLVHLLGE
jgi:Holliday junction resolvasome RuvABC endonuclease subunit